MSNEARPEGSGGDREGATAGAPAPVRKLPVHPVEVAIREAGLDVAAFGGQADQSFWDNPYPFYHCLRTYDPVYWSDRVGRWIVTGHSEIERGLRAGSWSSNRVPNAMRLRSPELRLELAPLMAVVSKQMAFADPPDHTRLRSLVNKAFSPRGVETFRERILELANDLLDAVSPGHMDVVTDFANLLPATVILEMLGLPPEDHQSFKRWSVDLTEFIANPNPGEEADRRAQQTVTEALEYFRNLAEQLRAKPRDDLLSALVAAEEHGDRLSKEELLANATFLLVAGHETTTNLIGNGLLALLRNPAQLESLRSDPALIGPAVEELLRYDVPIQLTGRTATADNVIGDKTVPAGGVVMFLLGAANRDPVQFADPDRLDITRQPNRHIAFGNGIHFCLGASLARLEGQIALGTLLGRCPDLRLDEGPLSWKPSVAVRGLRSLPVSWG